GEREAREDSRLGGQGAVQVHHQPRRRGEREVTHVVGRARELDDEAPVGAHGLDPDVAHHEQDGVRRLGGPGRLGRRGGGRRGGGRRGGGRRGGGRRGGNRRPGRLPRGPGGGGGGEAGVAQVDDHLRALVAH